MSEGLETETTAEPSMEEILASIRRIIADDEPPKAATAAEEAAVAAGEDVLELTQMVGEDGSVVDLKPPEEPPAVPEPAPVVAPPPPPPEPVKSPLPEEPPMAAPLDIAPTPEPNETLVSSQAANAATSSLATLASVVQVERMASVPPGTPIGNGMRTLEDMVMELMKPILKDWLDKNLPSVVDRLVQKEIERITKRNDS